MNYLFSRLRAGLIRIYESRLFTKFIEAFVIGIAAAMAASLFH